jgi:NADH:ubiquinone oxidoreductase subunit 6 (subunit J)
MIVLFYIGSILLYFIIGMIFTNWIRGKLDDEMTIAAKLVCALLFPIAYILYVSVLFFSKDREY